MTSLASALFSFGGSPAHMRREEMITATNAQAQEAQQAQQLSQIAKQAQPVAPATEPTGPQAIPGASQSFISAAAARPPERNLASKSLLGA